MSLFSGGDTKCMNCVFFLVLDGALAVLVKTVSLMPVAGTLSGPPAAMLASAPVGISVTVVTRVWLRSEECRACE